MNIEVATTSTMLCQCSQMVSMRQLSLYHIGIVHLLNHELSDGSWLRCALPLKLFGWQGGEGCVLVHAGRDIGPHYWVLFWYLINCHLICCIR